MNLLTVHYCTFHIYSHFFVPMCLFIYVFYLKTKVNLTVKWTVGGQAAQFTSNGTLTLYISKFSNIQVINRKKNTSYLAAFRSASNFSVDTWHEQKSTGGTDLADFLFVADVASKCRLAELEAKPASMRLQSLVFVEWKLELAVERSLGNTMALLQNKNNEQKTLNEIQFFSFVF